MVWTPFGKIYIIIKKSLHTFHYHTKGYMNKDIDQLTEVVHVRFGNRSSDGLVQLEIKTRSHRYTVIEVEEKVAIQLSKFICHRYRQCHLAKIRGEFVLMESVFLFDTPPRKSDSNNLMGLTPSVGSTDKQAKQTKQKEYPVEGAKKREHPKKPNLKNGSNSITSKRKRSILPDI